ncbi:response regulator transcription factor [Streptomyces sp. CA-135486]|uniref:response regulator transcription factor n=1 Tax=Streptomyces sp. CA-135486 TaxID=3240049 RepID=UPI003D8C1235
MQHHATRADCARPPGLGCTAAAMARRLAISHHTVNRHLENIYRKLGIHDRVTTVLQAQQLGLVNPWHPGRPADSGHAPSAPGCHAPGTAPSAGSDRSATELWPWRATAHRADVGNSATCAAAPRFLCGFPPGAGGCHGVTVPGRWRVG